MNAHRIVIACIGLALAACSQTTLVDENTQAPVNGEKGVVVANGGAALTAKNYGCTPLSYRTAGNVLRGLGVKVNLDPINNKILPPAANGNGNGNGNMGGGAGATPPGAAQVAYSAARSSFGVADYVNRNPESTVTGTAQLAKMGDLFIQAAPELIANFAASPRCGGISLFDGAGHPTREGMTCISGQVVSNDAVQLAGQLMDRAVAEGMTQQSSQELVIAGFLSAQFTCR